MARRSPPCHLGSDEAGIGHGLVQAEDDGTEQGEPRPYREGLWIKWDSCKEIIYRAEVERAGRSAPSATTPSASRRASASRSGRPGSYEERDTTLETTDPLGFKDTKSTGPRPGGRPEDPADEAVVCGWPDPAGPAVLCAFEFGSSRQHGLVVGRSSRARSRLAIDKQRAGRIVSASGGARMQEGILSLMQMAKTSAALQRLGDRRSRTSPS